ncbi:MAG: SEC-C domain-containing protein [Spirochaetaceae bacterium]|nr:SEC-C domain-containing protein [Spirochaetaceae bacterium]
MTSTESEALVRKGIRELSLHRPTKALEYFHEAVEQTPPACSDELSRALYWLSIALYQLDRKELALKSLANAQKLRRKSFARRFYSRTINEYGMLKRPTRELDDLYAFVSIQITVYLMKKKSHRFDSVSEHDTVMKSILSGWKMLKDHGFLEGLECGEKLALFKKVKLDFPVFYASSFATRRPSRKESSDPASYSDACPCGSGLPYRQCCGRTQGLSELL